MNRFPGADENAGGGTIPTEVGMLKDLIAVGLSYSEMTGTIPTEIGLLTSLYYLDFCEFVTYFFCLS